MTDTTDIPQYPLIINGEQREPLSGEYMDVVNPVAVLYPLPPEKIQEIALKVIA